MHVSVVTSLSRFYACSGNTSAFSSFACIETQVLTALQLESQLYHPTFLTDFLLPRAENDGGWSLAILRASVYRSDSESFSPLVDLEDIDLPRQSSFHLSRLPLLLLILLRTYHCSPPCDDS